MSKRTWDTITAFLVVFALAAGFNGKVALGVVLMGFAVLGWRKGS